MRLQPLHSFGRCRRACGLSDDGLIDPGFSRPDLAPVPQPLVVHAAKLQLACRAITSCDLARFVGGPTADHRTVRRGLSVRSSHVDLTDRLSRSWPRKGTTGPEDRQGRRQAAKTLQPGSSSRHPTTLDGKVGGTITASPLVPRRPCLFHTAEATGSKTCHAHHSFPQASRV
jgi:hypothetical protein